MSEDFQPSNLWKDISGNFKENAKDSLAMQNLKQGSFNQKIAYWNPATSGVRYFKTLLWNLASTLDSRDWEVLLNTRNRVIGNPSCMLFRGQYIDLDYIQSLFEFKSISQFFTDKPMSFLEIGAGYGRTAHVIIQNSMVSNYTIIDLPATLNLSKQYLSLVLSKYEYEKVCFISTDQLNATNKYTDLLYRNGCYDWAINIDSFAEMNVNTVESYLRIINSCADFLYVKNPVGKYQKWMITDEDHDVTSKSVQDAMSTGMLQDVIDINSQDEIYKASRKFTESYKPSLSWNIRLDQWAKPWHYYWEAIYKKSV